MRFVSRLTVAQRSVPALLVVGLVLAACGDDDVADGASERLRPADEVLEEAERDDAIKGVLGEPVELIGLRLIVESIEYLEDVDGDGTRSDFRIVVSVRSENRTDEPLSNPDMSVVCSNTDETGSWYGDSTFKLYKELPPGTFDEGNLILGFPTGCADPLIRAQMSGVVMDGENWTADWVVPETALSPG